MECETFYFTSANGLCRVFTRRWQPAGPPRAVVQIIHGMSEHSGRYSEFADYLVQAGLAVTAHDHIGHGQSVAAGQRYCFFAEQSGWDIALSDIGRMHALTQERWPGLPYFMFGHSMGSFLLRNYLLKPVTTRLSGAIFSGSGNISPARLKLGGLLIKLERKRLGAQSLSPLLTMVILGGYNRQFRPARTPVDWLSSEDAMVDDYLADPLCRKLPTVGLFDDINSALAVISKTSNMRLMDSALPLLLLSGENDPVGVNGRAVCKLYTQLGKTGCTDVSLRLYPGCRHALLMEKNRLEVFADIVAWLVQRIENK
jgi:alpha-beta hydrolase superfamily lysophospholipase